MKRLILVRHAKSSWEHDVIDHQRPLKVRGFKDAEIVSNHLKNSELKIDLALSSDAMRAKTTAHIFVKNLDISQDHFDLNHNLYDFSGENLIRTIKECDEKISTLMIFGHNYALTDFVNTYGNKYIDNVPTSGVVIIDFKIDSWKNLCSGITTKTVFPRDFK